MPAQSILIITNAYDLRDSTAVLRRIASTLAGFDDTRVDVFLLRHSTTNPLEWPRARVVDDLRTWWPAALIDGLAPTVAGRLRGLRLRWWLHQIDPDVVLLDDGLGARVIEHLTPRPFVVSRVNLDRPTGAFGEPDSVAESDLVIAPPDVTVPDSLPVLREHRFRSFSDAVRAADGDVRRATRQRLGLAEDAVVLSGWGTDGWLDGPDLFVRVLWALREHHGIDAHGIWFGTDQPAEMRRLREEAERCGVDDRYHQFPYHGHGEVPLDALSADVVVLPTREALLHDHIVPAAVAGLVTVTFHVADVDDRWIWSVDDLDIDAAAVEVVRALEGDRAERSRKVMLEVDMAVWSRHLLDLASRRQG